MRIYYWKKLHQDCNKNMRSCTEYQQVTLKEPWCVNLHLLIPQSPMSFISVNQLGRYSEMGNGNQYTLTVICMLTNHVFMVPIRTMATEDFINAYLKHVYSTFGGSKYILSNRSGTFTSKWFTWLVKELAFTKGYTSLYSPTRNSVIERTHSFLKASIRKIISNHNTDWDSIAHIAAMEYNMFLHSSSGEAPFNLMFGWDTYMATLSKWLLLKIGYMGDEKSRIHLVIMREVYMMTALSLKTARDKCPTPTMTLMKLTLRYEIWF